MLSIYEPSEDSFLLAKQVEKICGQILQENPKAKVLDMGTGTGIQALAALKAGVLRENILAVDVNKEAVKLFSQLARNLSA